MAGAGLISCPACAASYPWKPQLAGKKVRCKCGKLFEAKPPRALPAQPAEEPDVFALDEDSAYTAMPAKKKMPTRIPPGAAAAATMAPSAPAAPDLAAAYP